MIPLDLATIAERCKGRLVRRPGSDVVDSVETDSRRIKPGALFVAIGRGRGYVNDAMAAGAAAALVPEDAFSALAAISGAVRDRAAATVVAITGSVGKTSTKDILAGLCRPHRPTVSAEASYNNEIGVPLTLCRMTEQTEIAILEMGMRGSDQISDLCAFARPDIGLVTAVGPAHLEQLGSVEQVARAKAELITGLSAGGVAVVPAGETLLEGYLTRDDIDYVRFGDGGDVSLRRFEPTEDGACLDVDLQGRHVRLDVAFTSRHNADNLLAALAAYSVLDLPVEQVARGVTRIELSPLRDEELELPDGGLILNDCYNANPLSMKAALAHLELRCAGRRRVAILGDMAELGADAAQFHREAGAMAARAGVDVLIAVGAEARGYLDGCREAGSGASLSWEPTVQGGIDVARDAVRPGDCVLIKGSRAIGLEAVAPALAHERE